MNEYQKPQHDGIYWAKSGSYQWWNLLVIIGGEPPFLYCEKIIDLGMGKTLTITDIREWGPEIIRPE